MRFRHKAKINRNIDMYGNLVTLYWGSSTSCFHLFMGTTLPAILRCFMNSLESTVPGFRLNFAVAT